jgi:hypothetical protein
MISTSQASPGAWSASIPDGTDACGTQRKHTPLWCTDPPVVLEADPA